MNIAIIYSPDWSEYVKVQVYAIFRNNPPPVKVYLGSDTDGRMDLNKLAQEFGPGYETEFIDMEKLFRLTITSDLNIDKRFTKYALYRLLLPTIIKDDKLLHIDADAIVTGDITEMYNMDMGNALIAGVIDAGAEQYNLKAPIGFTPEDPYLNAGVLLMNMAKMRKEKLAETWIKEVNGQLYAAHDQCIINKTCKGRTKVLDLKYNVSLSTGLELQDIAIMHYAGEKPWKTPSVPHNHIWEYWQAEYRRTRCLNGIPKVIHYCWFGGKPKPPLVKWCLQSWATILPDYEIKEWNESNFPVEENPYTKSAYENGKYAFVTDYVRLWALWKYGGIYMDADVEILQQLDKFLKHRAFTGHETEELMVTAIMGAQPGHEWIQMLINHYTTAKFGVTPNTQTITELSKPFVQKHENGHRYLSGGVVIYPVETFCPYDHKNLIPIPTENSYAIHHFAGSWLGRKA